jgi:lipopolysaccharide transport system permease protein
MFPAPLPHIPGTYFLRNLRERRNLLAQLVRRDFGQRFVGSIAGWLWGVFHPLVLLLSWTFVFQVCLKISLQPGEVTQNYTLFLFSGFLPWLLFQDTVQRSTTAVVEYSNLIKRTVFPVEMIPVAIFLSSLVQHLIAVTLAIAVAAVWLRHLSPMVLMLPAYTVLLGMFAVGVAWITSSLHMYLRDTAQVLSVALTFWFWLTPIFITRDHYPSGFRFLITLNPLAVAVNAYRDRLLSSRPPDLHEVALIAAYGVASFVIGGLFFRFLKRGFADVL